MSLVNELLDDLQQQQRKHAGPLDIPALAGAPQARARWPRFVFISLLLVLSSAVLIALLWSQNPVWQEAEEQKKSLPLQLKLLAKHDKTAIRVSGAGKVLSAQGHEASAIELNTQTIIDENRITLWLQSPELLDLGLVKLDARQQQLLIKQALELESIAPSLGIVDWLQLETKLIAGQSLLTFNSVLPMQLKLEAVREKMGWFHYELIIKAERDAWQATQAAVSKPVLPQNELLESGQNSSLKLKKVEPVKSQGLHIKKNHFVAEKSDRQVLQQLQALVQQGQTVKAIEVAEQTLAQVAEDDFVQTRLWLLQQLLSTMQWQRFDVLMNKGLTLQGINKALVKLAARAKLKQQDYAQAWQLLAQLPIAAKADAEHLQLFANVAYRLQRYTKAEELYRALVLAYPKNALYVVGLARALDAQQQEAQAQKAYELAFQLGLPQGSINKFVVKRIVQLKNNINK